MALFGARKAHDLASIYTEQARDRIDQTIMPVFPPDQALSPGDTAMIQHGQLVRGGTVKTRGLIPLLAPDAATAPWNYATGDSVSIGPSVEVPNPVQGGSPLVKATMTLKSDRSVVASFNKGTESRVHDSRAFGTALMQMWFARQLGTNELVVWSSRQSVGATVVVSLEGNNEIEIVADSSLLGGLGISLSGLSAGVRFGRQTKATYQVSDPGVTFTSSVRAFWLPLDARRQIDRFGFSDDPDSMRSAAADFEPEELTVAEFTALAGETDGSEEDQFG